MEHEFGLNPRIVSKLQAICEQNDQIQRLILFGSRARGTYKYNSDIDLAYESSGEPGSSFYFEMEEAVELYKLDLLDLNDIDETLLRMEIQKGIVLYESN